ncbi:MAG: 1-acyl-sn-glycerol-3-phosphate acyltransferase [Gallionellaceae bacterium]|nr:1-acyl-sn-glycerol-3-phosphate acyltransferase [Gallionellaceae bacterium]
MRPGVFGRFCATLLRLFGWRVIFVPPTMPKAVVIVYPHTSNWDFIVGILARFAIALPAHWVGKDSLFHPPFGTLFRRLGGIPVNRRQSTGFADGLIKAFDKTDSLYLAIAPEGTRSKVKYWKSGFYRVALAANVPLGLAFIDYSRNEVGIDTWLSLSGNEVEDLAGIRAFYSAKRGKRPEKEGEIRFR